MNLTPKDADDDSIHIRDMWNENLEEEFVLIREIVDWYNYVAMDTEFPGVVLRPIGSFKNINDYNYQNLKENIDMLKLIQLGLTFSDEDDNKLFDIAGISVFDIDQSIIGDGVCRDWGEDYI